MHGSPYQLTGLILAGSLISAGGFLGAGQHSHTPPVRIICIAAMLFGTIGLYWAAALLSRDVRNQRWTEDALAPFRRVIDHPAWKVVLALLLFAMLLTLVKASAHRSYFWFVFLLLQAQTQIGAAFARPTRLQHFQTLVDWSKLPRLDSEHSGER